MNRSVLQSSAVQQIMAGSPNWWNINNMRPPPSQTITSSFLASPPNLFPYYMPAPPQPPTSSGSLVQSSSWNDNQELPESWGQLLLGGLVGEEQVLQQQAPTHTGVDVKQENSVNSYMYGHGNVEFEAKAKATWSQIMPVSSPKSSCVTTLSSSSSSMLNFCTKSDARRPPPDHSSECNSTGSGGVAKKPRVHPTTSTQSTFKSRVWSCKQVRKEKLGDRITALHQLVSPFGKTDTASVLLEAIGYIRFLQSQVEALSLPYLGTGSAGNMRQQHQVQGERNCLFPEDPGQLLHDNHMKKRQTPPDQECKHEGATKDLRSRGLCLVPLSCTLQVGSDNGADYWAPAFNGGFR